jgi:hypothetical protein
MDSNSEILEIDANAARQYIDAVATFEAWEEAQAEAAQVRGSMYWHKSPTGDPAAAYLVRKSASGSDTSLGRRSPETEAIYERFVQRKAEAADRLKGLKESLERHRRVNRALRVGRVDPLVVAVLNKLEASGLSEHFRVVGTHALYAYEAAAGVRFAADALATRDIDLLWDVRKRLQFATTLQRIDSSMLGVFQQVDKTFRRRAKQLYTAVNKDGFEIDILRREQTADDPHPIKLSHAEDDFYAVQAPKAHLLMDAPPFSAVVVATNGTMARMHTLHPMHFVRFKTWMSKLEGREAIKRSRDALQARLVEAVVAQYLPHLRG